MNFKKPSLVTLCLLAMLAALAGCSSEDQTPEAASPLLTSRASDKQWAQGFDGNWDAFSPLLTQRAPDKQWATDFDPNWDFFLSRPSLKRQASISAAPKSSKPSPRPALKGAVSLKAASDCFELFAKDWLAKISRNLRHTDLNMDVAPSDDGYAARFTRVVPETLEFNVKPSTSPSCSYVAVLHYEEHHFEGRGQTLGQAQQGPFARIGRLKVTEIFRFVAGRWVN